MIRTFVILLLGWCAGCVSRVDVGQRLFFNCEVDRSTLECVAGTEGAPAFDGNGRTCATCHRPQERFSVSPETIAALPPGDPLFVPIPGLEDPKRLRSDALIRVDAPGGIHEFRQTPKLVHLRKLCDRRGRCQALGLRGDRVRDLCAFSNQAIENHLTKRVGGVDHVDFRTMTARECKAMVAYLVSRRVSSRR